MGGTGSCLSIARGLLPGPGMLALVGAGLTSAVTDPSVSGAQTHTSSPGHGGSGWAGPVPCGALVGRNDADSRRELLSWAEVSRWPGAARPQALASSHPPQRLFPFLSFLSRSAGFVAADL